MSEQLEEFLVDLSVDSQQRARFVADPVVAMAGAGLSGDEQRALIRRDAAGLRKAIKRSEDPTQVTDGARKPRKPRKPRVKKKTKKTSRKKTRR